MFTFQRCKSTGENVFLYRGFLTQILNDVFVQGRYCSADEVVKVWDEKGNLIFIVEPLQTIPLTDE